MLDVVQVPVALPEIRQVGRPPVSRTERTVAELRFGAKGVQEPLQRVLAPLATLMKGELFRLAAVADGLQLGGDFVERFVPRDSFPLSFAALADTFQRIQQSLGMIQVVQARLASRTEMSTAVGVVRIAFDLDEPAVFDVADDAADRAAQLAHPGHFLHVLVLVAIRPIAFGLRSRQLADTGHRAEAAQFVRLALDAVPLLQVDAACGTPSVAPVADASASVDGLAVVATVWLQPVMAVSADMPPAARPSCRNLRRDSAASLMWYFARVQSGRVTRWTSSFQL